MALKVHIPLVLYIIPDRRKRIFFWGGGGGFVLLESFLCTSIRYILIEGNADWLYNSKCTE